MPFDNTACKLKPADVIGAPSSSVEIGKRTAARTAIDAHVQSGMVVGVGSGSTIVYGIQRLAERVHGEEKLDIICIPTSFQSRQLLLDTGCRVSDLNVHPEVDVCIDGADEVDPHLNCVKGGGACQTQEKLVAAAAKVFIVVADQRKQSRRLLTAWRKGIPLEVLPEAITPLCRTLLGMGGTPVLRMAGLAKAGPVITDGGKMVIDADFAGGQGIDPASVSDLHSRLKLLCGVVETGLFPAPMARVAYFGKEDGSVEVWDAQQG